MHELYLDMFFFFKQKTAYEMRISDWSSDVCSSDLKHDGRGLHHRGNTRAGGIGAWHFAMARSRATDDRRVREIDQGHGLAARGTVARSPRGAIRRYDRIWFLDPLDAHPFLARGRHVAGRRCICAELRPGSRPLDPTGESGRQDPHALDADGSDRSQLPAIAGATQIGRPSCMERVGQSVE